MPTATALRSFDHNGKYAKGDTVTFDRITMDALRRSRLVGPDIAETAKPVAPQGAPVPTVGALGKPGKKSVVLPAAPASTPPTVGALGKPGKKSAVLPAAPASTPPTLPPSTAGDLPPPLPVA